jgi:hypothetical protein
MPRRTLSELAKLARVTRDLPPFLRTPLHVGQAAEIIEERLRSRQERFLRMTQRLIYNNPRSPYLQLLRNAGCEFSELTVMVARNGLEGALAQLAAAGVYLTFDELKGRKEVVRGSRRFSFGEDDFDNPAIAPHIESWSGGSRGPSTSVKMTLPYFGDLAVNTAVALRVHGLSEYDHAIWLQGFTPGLIYAKLGSLPLAWFYPVGPLPAKFRIASWYMTILSRLVARPIPPPMFVDVGGPDRVARWLANRQRDGRRICLTSYASSAVRIAVVARERGVALDGVCFITLGEAFTEVRQRMIEAAGARALVRYAFSEAGIIGYGCGNGRASDDVHFFSDSYGLIQKSRPLGDPGLAVDAFLFTSLLPSAPKVLLNVESGDYGIIERRSCGCEFGELGLENHISRIRSFEKLSGEGMTFVQTDLLRVLEEVLPARFGGTSADYQALEEEGENGILRLVLLVSPGVGPADEEDIRQTFLRELERTGDQQYMARIWRRARTVVVRRQWPVATRAGKILPFHLLGASVRRPVATPQTDLR